MQGGHSYLHFHVTHQSGPHGNRRVPEMQGVAFPIAGALPGVTSLLEQINMNSGTCYEAIHLLNAFSSIRIKKESQKEYAFTRNR